MRVLLVNNTMENVPGGAETVVAETARLLTQEGHQIIPFSIVDSFTRSEPWRNHSPERRRLARRPTRLHDSLATVYSLETKRRITRLVSRFRPDVAHLHNVYEKLTLSVVDGLYDHCVPMVMTLHDYRAVCPNGRLWVRGSPCERCIGSGSFAPSVMKRCNEGSLVRSTVAAVEAMSNRWARRYDKVSVIIAPSRFLAEKIAHPLGHRDICFVPNPVQTSALVRRDRRVPTFVFAGRLVEEKGLETILDAAEKVRSPARIEIIGEGRLAGRVKQVVAAKRLPVDVLGYVPRSEVKRRLAGARAALLPSLWYENCPMGILEAASVRTPTIASALGGLRELIDDGVDGVLVPPGDADALAAAIDELCCDPHIAGRLGDRAQSRVRRTNSPHLYASMVIDCYRRAIAERSAA